jgi:hypothetical protein
MGKTGLSFVPANRARKDGGAERSAGKVEASRRRRGCFGMSAPDPLLRYVLEAKPVHNALRRALIQLSGFFLKRLTAGQSRVVDFEPLESAREGLGEACEGLHSLRTPAAAAHHRLHLDGAAAALERGLAAALSSNDPDGDEFLRSLEEAERHLRVVGRALPGFEAVDFTQACCAAHIHAAPRSD